MASNMTDRANRFSCNTRCTPMACAISICHHRSSDNNATGHSLVYSVSTGWHTDESNPSCQ